MHQKKYQTGPQVRERYHISEMTLHRWERNPNLGFPKPLIINRRKFYDEEELVAWERSRAKVSA